MFASCFFAALLLSAVCAGAQEVEHTIKSNLEYRMTKGDLPALSFGVEKPKAVQVTEGAAELLEDCLNRPATWSRDSLVFRLAHTHAASIKSCRENASPSMHVVFRSLPDGTLETWVHFDGHGAQTSGSRMVHLGEFLYHKATLRNNDQDQMHDNLERSLSAAPSDPAQQTEELTNHERSELFLTKTLTRVGPYASSAVSAAAMQMFSPTAVWGKGMDRYTNHMLASFSQRVVTYGLQSGVAAALHEDLRYKRSLESSTWKRARHALLSTVILETPRGRDVAFANIAAAIGSGVVINTCHPGRENFTHPGAWKLSALNFAGFAQTNLWAEFKPDIKYFVRSKVLHRP
jgi:hypothetical protein